MAEDRKVTEIAPPLTPPIWGSRIAQMRFPNAPSRLFGARELRAFLREYEALG